MFNFVITNESILPYSVEDDTVRLKLGYLNNHRISYVQGVSGVVWGNIGSGGLPVEMGSFITDTYGYASVTYDTDFLPDKKINTCNVWVSGVYQYSGIPSSLAQVHFLNTIDPSFDNFFGIIDDRFIGDDLETLYTSGIPISPPRGAINSGTSLHFRVYDANLNNGSGVRGFCFTRTQ